MNYLITKTKLIEVCPGSDHAQSCKKLFGYKLRTFLQRGGVRVKIHLDSMAVEFYGQVVGFQVKAINKILRKNVVHRLVLPDRVIERFVRPIKSFRL